jgi:uncharacterized protein (TIGR00369 family)
LTLIRLLDHDSVKQKPPITRWSNRSMIILPPPEGYEPYELRVRYADYIGPFHRCVKDGVEWFALRVEPRHANGGPMAHGGMIASLADIVLGRAAVRGISPKRTCLTISLSVDYLESAPLGSWLEACAVPERIGRSIAFVKCRMMADEKHIAQARAVLKLIAINPDIA